MNSRRILKWILALGILLTLAISSGTMLGRDLTRAEGNLLWRNTPAVSATAFTYQGRLTDADHPVNGTCDFVFRLYNEPGTGSPPVGGTHLGTEEKQNVQLREGAFTVKLDFGSNAFTGEARWLEISVNCGDGVATLSPRQELTPSPYALHSSTSNSVPWGGLIGIPSGFADGIDDNTHLSEAEVEGYVTNAPLNLAEGTTLGGEQISTLVSGGCEAIQRAIDELPPPGGEVVIETGIYTCTQSVVIDRDNVALRGQGPATVLRLADGANLPLMVVGQNTTPPTSVHTNIQVADLTIDGNRDNQDYECYNNDCATYPIRNNGITLRGVSDVIVERITAIGARSGGLVTEKGCQRVAVRDFTAVDNYFDGLAAYETENSRFSGLHLFNNCAAGLSFDLDFNNNIVNDVVIVRDSDSRCEPDLQDGTVGVFMRDARDNVFGDMQIRNMREHGIFLAQETGVSGTAATGNTFVGVIVSGAGGAGLRANDPTVVNTLVTGSQFIGNADACISEVVGGQVQTSGIICR